MEMPLALNFKNSILRVAESTVTTSATLIFVNPFVSRILRTMIESETGCMVSGGGVGLILPSEQFCKKIAISIHKTEIILFICLSPYIGFARARRAGCLWGAAFCILSFG